jgi:cysteinyl-tRNA synthetase
MGLLQHSASEWAAWRPAGVVIDEAGVDRQIAERNAARKAKNFKEADRIRDELAAMGIELEDKKDGTTTWKVKR